MASREVRSGDMGVADEAGDARMAAGAVAAEARVGVPLRLPTGDSSSLKVRLRCRSDLLGARRDVIGVERPVVLTRSCGVEVSAEVMSDNEDVR